MPCLNAAASWRCLGLMPGVPATGLLYVAALLPSGYLRSSRRWCSAPWCGRPHMPCSARGSAGSLAAILIAGASIAVGAVTAAVPVRCHRTPLPPPELRLSLPEIEGGGRAVARPPPQPGELPYIAWAAA
jgi:hypothetical protein